MVRLWSDSVWIWFIRSSTYFTLWFMDSSSHTSCMPKWCFPVMEVTNIMTQFSLLLEFQPHYDGDSLAFEIWRSFLWGLFAASNISWCLSRWQASTQKNFQQAKKTARLNEVRSEWIKLKMYANLFCVYIYICLIREKWISSCRINPNFY